MSSNAGILSQLRALLDSGRLVHAFLFFGGSPESRRQLASELCGMLIPGHPEDLIKVEKAANRAGIGAEDIEELQEKLKYKPYGERYAVVVEDAHLMNTFAQNKLLKTLEEPVSPAVIILLSAQKESMLPTVLSRCSCYQLEDDRAQEDPDAAAAADLMLGLLKQGAPFYRKKAALSVILGDKNGLRDKTLAFLDSFEQRLLEEAQKAPTDSILSASDEVRKARKAVRQSHNAAYTLKQLCLRI